MNLFGDGPIIKRSQRRSKLEELMDEKRRLLAENRASGQDDSPGFRPIESLDKTPSSSYGSTASTRIEIPQDFIGGAISEAMEQASAQHEHAQSEISEAQVYRRSLERELELTRGAVSERVLDLKDELAKTRVQLRDRDERIALLLERIERTERDGSSESQSLRSQMEDVSSRYERTLADHRDLFQTCEKELIHERSKSRELASDVSRLKREIQDQLKSNQTTLNLFERSEKQYVESEKERLQLRILVQDLERKVAEISRDARISHTISTQINELSSSLESLESFFDFAQTKGTTPHTFKAGAAILVVLRNTISQIERELRQARDLSQGK